MQHTGDICLCKVPPAYRCTKSLCDQSKSRIMSRPIIVKEMKTMRATFVSQDSSAPQHCTVSLGARYIVYSTGTRHGIKSNGDVTQW